jgi:hypothetical protein
MNIIDHGATRVLCAGRHDKQERLNMNKLTVCGQRLKSLAVVCLIVGAASVSFSSPAFCEPSPQPTTIANGPSQGDEDWCDPELQAALVSNTEDYLINTMQKGQTAITEQMRSFATNPMKAHDTMGKTACIDRLLTMFKELSDRVGKTTPMGKLWESIYERLMNDACNYALSVIKTEVDNALDLLCIPYPEFGYFSPDLPVPQRNSCAGHNLVDLMQFTRVIGEGYGSRVPEDYLGSVLSRMIDIRGTSVGISTANW